MSVDYGVIFPTEEVIALENQIIQGNRAKEILHSADWRWIEEFILGAMDDEAKAILRSASTEESRIRAQQMFLAAEKPRRQIEHLAKQGDAAKAALAKLSSTPNEEEN